MRKRPLGNSGWLISEVGLGCWQFGGDFGPMAEEISFAILETAAACGINFVDTANVYGNGESERRIGAFHRANGELFRIATKYGRGPDAYPDRYSLEGMRASVDSSRKRLGVEAIDLLQLHCVPTEILRKGEIFDWLRILQREGSIRYFGASVETVEEGLICLDQEGITSLQVIFNLFRQKLTTELLPQAESRGVGIIVRLPLASGLLSGKFNASTQFLKSDHRNFNRDGQCFNVGETFAGLPFEQGVRLSDQLTRWVPSNMDRTQFALRWILDHPAVSTIIPGASSPHQVTVNASSSSCTTLSDNVMKELEDFYRREVASHIRGPY